MKIVFVGNVKFSFETLKATIENGGEVKGVVTGLDSKINSDFYDLGPICQNKNIPIIESALKFP